MEKLPRQTYTKEFREQAVRLVIEQKLTIPEAEKRLSMSGQTLSNWVFKARHGKLAGIDAHRTPVTDLEAENSKLKRALAEARMERDTLKKATTAYFAKASLRGHAFMKTLRPPYPVSVMCRVFDVSRSGYHAFASRSPSKRAQESARLEVAIQAAHTRTRGTYGPGRLQDELNDEGIKAGVSRIKRLRKKLGLRCKQVRKFKATTNSNHDLPVAPNLLNQKFDTTRPNET